MPAASATARPRDVAAFTKSSLNPRPALSGIWNSSEHFSAGSRPRYSPAAGFSAGLFPGSFQNLTSFQNCCFWLTGIESKLPYAAERPPTEFR